MWGQLHYKRVYNLGERYPPCTSAGVYPYMEDLQRMDMCATTEGLHLLSKLASVSITSPLQWRVWDEALRDHPDQRFRSYIVTGLRDGFRIGFQGARSGCTVTKNMRSAEEKADVISRYLQEECASGRVLGPLNEDFSNLGVMVNRFGVIPKGTSGKWRLIVDLSFPEGNSVNDGIDSAFCSLHYVKVDDAAKELFRQGRGSCMAKVDIRSVYRTVPVIHRHAHIMPE